MKPTIVVALVAAALVWAGLAAQEARPRPGVGTGVVTVTGAVDVANTPEVRALQNGEWRVAVANTPTVRLAQDVPAATPSFVERGGRYRIVWNTVESELVTVTDTGQAGWLRVQSPGSSRRWVNINAARALEEVR